MKHFLLLTIFGDFFPQLLKIVKIPYLDALKFALWVTSGIAGLRAYAYMASSNWCLQTCVFCRFDERTKRLAGCLSRLSESYPMVITFSMGQHAQMMSPPSRGEGVEEFVTNYEREGEALDLTSSIP